MRKLCRVGWDTRGKGELIQKERSFVPVWHAMMDCCLYSVSCRVQTGPKVKTISGCDSHASSLPICEPADRCRCGVGEERGNNVAASHCGVALCDRQWRGVRAAYGCPGIWPGTKDVHRSLLQHRGGQRWH